MTEEILKKVKAKLNKTAEDNMTFKSEAKVSVVNQQHLLARYEDQIKKKTGLSEIDYKDADVDYQKVKISWRVDLEARNWGLKNISIYAPAQTISIGVSGIVYDENEKEHDFDFEAKIKLDDIESDTSKVDLNHGDISAHSLELDFSSKDKVKAEVEIS